MSAKVEQAVKRFSSGFNCSQAVLSSYSEQLGLDCEKAFKVATGFGGGMRTSDTCGAVTGAFMALGLKYGNVTAEVQENKTKKYEKVVEFTNRFIISEILSEVKSLPSYASFLYKSPVSHFSPK